MLPGNEAAPDFSDPLGLLKACHQRILGFCELLEKLDLHLKHNGLDNDARQAIQKIHHYFSTAGKLHHLDEEQNLFPLLIRQSSEMSEIIHSLKQDHVMLESTWTKLEPLLLRPETIEEDSDFSNKIDTLCEAYRKHIKKEDEGILDTARHILDSKQLSQLGKNMKQRRNITEKNQ